MVDGLRPNDRTPAGNRIERNHALAVVTLDVELTQVLGRGTFVIGNLQDHLVLIRRFLDEVAVILRVGVMQKRQNPRLGDAVQLRLVAQNIDLQIWSVVVEIGIHEQESWILVHLRDHLAGCVVHFVGINSGKRVGELALRIGRGPGADFQSRVRLEERHDARNRTTDSSHQLSRHLRDRSTLRWIFQKRNQERLI